MIIIGLLLGAFIGIIGGILPGITSTLLVFVISLLGLPGEFIISFVIGSEATSGMVKLLGLINPSVIGEQVYVQRAAATIASSGNAVKTIADSAFAYLLIKVVFTLAGSLLLCSDLGSFLKVGMTYQGLIIPFSVFLWGAVLFQSERKLLTGMLLIISIAVGLMVSRWQGANQTYSLIVALIGIGNAMSALETMQDKPNKSKAKPKETSIHYSYVPISGVVAGWVSTIFMGIPGSALMSVVDQERDPHKRVIKGAVLEASTSALNMTMMLGNLGSRSAGATIGGAAMEGATSVPMIIGYGLFTLAFTGLMYSWLPSLTAKYMQFNNELGNKVGGSISILISIISVVCISGPLAIPLLMIGYGMSHMIKEHELNPVIPLIALSALPIAGLLGI